MILLDETTRTISNYMVMLIFFLFKSAESLLQPSIMIFILQQVCENENLPATLCEMQDPNKWNHGGTEVTLQQKKEIQKKVENYLLAYHILLNLPAVFFCLFAGSWSDRVGRKFPMMLPPFGAILAVCCFSAATVVKGTATLIWVMARATVYGIFGKSTVMTMACSSYVSDVSTCEERTEILGRLLAMNFFGILLGSLLAGVMRTYGGIFILLMIIVAVNLLMELLIVLFVEESVEVAESAGFAQLVCPCINVEERTLSVKDSIGVLLTNRPQRPLLFILFASLFIKHVCQQGEEDAVLLLVDQQPFNWPGQYYGYYLSVYYGCMGLNLVLVLPLLDKFLKPRDSSLIIFGLFVKLARQLMISFAQSTWLMMSTAVLGCIAGFVVTAIRSLFSKRVKEDEIGQAFALLSIAEALAILISPSIFTPVYAATVYLFSRTVFVIFAIIYSVLLLIFLIIYLNSCDRDLDSDAESGPSSRTKNVVTAIASSEHGGLSESVAPNETTDSNGADQMKISHERSSKNPMAKAPGSKKTVRR